MSKQKAPAIRATALPGRSEFGDRLRAFRLRRGLNAPALARALGVAKSSVTNWETGVSFPAQPMIPRLCDLLCVTPNALYGFADAETDLSRDERDALRLYRRLPPADRKNILSFMQAMLDNAQAALREECRTRWIVRPCLRDRVCAGSGSELFADGESEPCFLPDTPETRAADAVIVVTGDSMAPTYADAQPLLVRYQPEIRPGEIGIFLVGGQGTVKEYQPDGLHPHNPAYPVVRPEEGKEIRCVGRVLGAVLPSMRPDRARRALLQELLAGGALPGGAQ